VTANAGPRWFAVRRVNPFEGVLQVVEAGPGRAYSANGRVWQIQVLADRPDHTWRSHGAAEPVRQFFSLGLWDPDDGLTRVVANPMLDIGDMMRSGEALTETVAALLDRLPFPLVDTCECWSLDQDRRPVALLATTDDPATLTGRRIDPWQATRSTDLGFHSDALDAVGVPQTVDPGPRQHARVLEHRIREAGPHHGWFQRDADGGVLRLDGQGDVNIDHFPPLGLRTDWPDRPTRKLVRDYLDWLAPRLLTLTALSDSERRRLEQVAGRRAVELASLHRLLPRVIDPTIIEAARVEARLRRAATGTKGTR
jgi:hypothetical protein